MSRLASESETLLAGRYRLGRRLGEGGAGSTHAAFDVVRGEEVALKVVRSGGPAEALERELELLGRLSHPSLPALYDHGRAGGRRYLAMRRVEGPDLARWLTAGRGWAALTPVLVDVLDALAFLHRLGVRHGDVKPENVLLDAGSGEGARGVLIDFGCAAAIGPAPAEVSGTLAFLAPELLEPGAPVDGRADVFAFGRLLERCAEVLGPAPAPWRGLARRMTRARVSQRPDAVEALETVGAADRARAPLPPEHPSLLGRDAALARFDAALAALLGDAPVAGARVLSLVGEPGSGRSRLLGELRRRASLHELHVGLHVEVLEARAEQPSPVASLFARSGAPAADGVEGALEALARLDARPRVWVLDDLDRLPRAEQQRVQAVARALSPDDGLLLLAVGELEGAAVERVEVGALDAEAIGAWAEGRIEARDVPELVRVSAGHAATVRFLLGAAAHGAPMAELARLAARGGLALGRAVARALERLAPAERRVVAALAASDAPLALGALDPGGLRHALSSGWARLEGGLARLARPADAAAVRAALPPAERVEAHAELARWHGARGERAEEARHAAGAGLRDAARAALEQVGGVELVEGPAWRATAEVLAEDGDAGLRLHAARLLEALGAPARAAEVLRALRAASEIDPALVHLRLGACLLKLERTEEALAELSHAQALAPDDEARARAADLTSRALIKRGEYAEAIEQARAALAWTTTPQTVAALEEDLGVALSYRGDASAEARLREAERLLATSGGPRDRVRVSSYLAIDAYRRGRLEEAGVGYERALRIAEEHRLEDQIAHAALNLGTVHHQRGAWAEALAAYRRGQRVAQALGQSATLATLELDFAQLYVDIGALERARAAAERAEEEARRGGFALIEGACALVRAQVELAEGRLDEAARAAAAARALFEARGAERERQEVALLEAELALARGEPSVAARILGELGALVDDLGVRRALLLARVLEPEAGRAALERAAAAAERLGYGPMRAQAHAELARVWRALGGPTLADSEARKAREAWERVASGLEPALHDVFWGHPTRAGLAADEGRGGPSERERRLVQLVAINRKLSSTLAVDDVLHQAIDAAIELTGAERGFLVLRREDGAITVPVARNLDKEKIGRSHTKLSRSIAERAMETGELVVTVDALADARFRTNVSVHAMKLRSVIAVPIPSPDGVVGALYLDNRFERGRFSEVDTDLLRAFADQVAIALGNARLHEALGQRTRELDEERARVVELSRGQAREIERLSDALAHSKQVLARRYDYGALVAESAAMQPVLARLEKVIDSPLTVLVQGESGTGKELVARAVHFNGPRKDEPFVTVNCAALPDTLLESELFGHVRGAFTGADRDRDGLMVAAGRGTLFLDEIGEMSLTMQAKLLRALEQREVRPLGGARSVAVDFRLVCATNRELLEEARTGRFREDLYYRVGVVEVRLPPLRERLEDLPELARRTLARGAEELGRAAPTLSGEAMRVLLAHRWPGNVRQLQNVLRAAMVMADGPVIEPVHLERVAVEPAARTPTSRAERDVREKARILEALSATDWNMTEAARRAGISRATLYRKLDKHRIPLSRR